MNEGLNGGWPCVRQSEVHIYMYIYREDTYLEKPAEICYKRRRSSDFSRGDLGHCDSNRENNRSRLMSSRMTSTRIQPEKKNKKKPKPGQHRVNIESLTDTLWGNKKQKAWETEKKTRRNIRVERNYIVYKWQIFFTRSSGVEERYPGWRWRHAERDKLLLLLLLLWLEVDDGFPRKTFATARRKELRRGEARRGPSDDDILGEDPDNKPFLYYINHPNECSPLLTHLTSPRLNGLC